MRKPVFKHDCTGCQYLGTITLDGKTFDMYYCAGEPTIIARFSNEDSEYASGLPVAKRVYTNQIDLDRELPPYLEAMGIAYGRALRKNYIK
jgi:hypothetical protein